MPPNYSKNDFESVKSELVWKLENWNGGRLDRLQVGMSAICQVTIVNDDGEFGVVRVEGDGGECR